MNSARRCLVPADGFSEWTGQRPTRQPWLVRMGRSALFAFTGLSKRWTVRDGITLGGSLAGLASGEAIETFTILTTEANKAVSPVHDRMPVILLPEQFGP